MIIRLATFDDVDEICSMYRDFFAFNANMQPTYYNKAECGDYPLNTMKSETADIIIAQQGETVVGFLHVSENKTSPYDCVEQYKFATCVDLYVNPIYREQGVATALLTAAKDWAKKRGLAYMELNVLAENENAMRLYEREGFGAVSHFMRCELQ